jgi:hypothetical protein
MFHRESSDLGSKRSGFPLPHGETAQAGMTAQKTTAQPKLTHYQKGRKVMMKMGIKKGATFRSLPM